MNNPKYYELQINKFPSVARAPIIDAAVVNTLLYYYWIIIEFIDFCSFV